MPRSWEASASNRRTQLDPAPYLAAADLPPSLQPDPVHAIRDARGLYCGVTEAAKLVGVSRSSFWRYARSGRIKSVVLGTKSRREYKFLRVDVAALKGELDAERSQREARSRKRLQKQLNAFWRLAAQMAGTGQPDLGRLLKMPGSERIGEADLNLVIK